jgi:hypothetical protein
MAINYPDCGDDFSPVGRRRQGESIDRDQMKSRVRPWRSPIRSPGPAEAPFRKRVVAPLTAVKAGTLLQANIGAKSSCILEVRARLVTPELRIMS